MKKLALVLAVSLSASPAFAAKATTFSFVGPNGGTGQLTTILTAPFYLGKVPALILTKGTSGFLLPFSQGYKLTLPGFGTAGPAQTATYALPILGDLNLSFQNGGKGGTFTYIESLTSKLEP